MVAAFGWSAGDIATAIKVVWKVIEAFNQSRGAAQKYAASSQFLRALVPVLERIAEIQADEADVIHGDVREQAITIWSSFMELENYFERRHGLSTRNESSIRKVVDTIKWTLDEMNDRVQKMRVKLLDSMAVMENLLVLDVRQKVQVILEDVRLANQTSGQNTAALVQTSHILTEIRDHIESLERVASDYQVKLQTLDSKQESQQHQGEAEQISSRLLEIETSQKELTKSLSELNQHIVEQSKRTISEEERAKWTILQQETVEHTDELTRTQINSQELIAKTQNDLNTATTLLDGTADLTGRRDMRNASTKLGGAGKLFSVLGPASGGLMSKFGKKSPQSNEGTPSTRPQPNRDYATPIYSRPDFSRRPKERVPVDPKYIPPPPPIRRVPNSRNTSDARLPMTVASSDLLENRPPLPARPQTVAGVVPRSTPLSNSSLSPRLLHNHNISPQLPALNNAPPPTLTRPTLPPRRLSSVDSRNNPQLSAQSPPPISSFVPTPSQLVRTTCCELAGTSRSSDCYTAPVQIPKSPPEIPARKAFPVAPVRSLSRQGNTARQTKVPVSTIAEINLNGDDGIEDVKSEDLSFAAKLKLFSTQPLITR